MKVRANESKRACSTCRVQPKPDEVNDDFQDILINGVNFRKGGERSAEDKDKVKTKARKKLYITGAHGSGSARQKARYRRQRAARSGRKTK